MDFDKNIFKKSISLLLVASIDIKSAEKLVNSLKEILSF